MSFAQPLGHTFDNRKESRWRRSRTVGRVMVPVADQDTAIAFYTEKLGFSLTADVPFGDGDRWVEVGLPPAAPRSRSFRRTTTTRPAG